LTPDIAVRRHWRGLLAAVALVLCACTDVDRPRNVVLVVVDTLRADHLGFYGYERPTSPQLDAWVERGAVFEQAIATSPWTIPSFASLYSGELPSRHGARRASGTGGAGVVIRRLNPETRMLAEILSERGFASAAVVNNPFLEAKTGLARGFAHYDYHPSGNYDVRRAGEVIDRGLAWLEASDEAPFLLVLHLFDPHLNYDPPRATRGRFTAGYKGRLRYPVSDLPRVRRNLVATRPADRAFIIGAYDEELLYIDGELARLLERLEGAGRFDDTLVVLVSDHGEELFDHGGFEHGHTVYQELLRVPLVVWGPGVRPGRLETPVSIADVLPTLLDALGLPAEPDIVGRSLWPLLRHGAAPRERALFAENTLEGTERKALLRWPHKLLLDADTGESQLFDLAADPGETRDRSGEMPRLVDTLRVELDASVGERRAPGPSAPVEFSDEVAERLRQLGYLDAAPD
jgi:choline-sulfatase